MKHAIVFAVAAALSHSGAAIADFVSGAVVAVSGGVDGEGVWWGFGARPTQGYYVLGSTEVFYHEYDFNLTVTVTSAVINPHLLSVTIDYSNFEPCVPYGWHFVEILHLSNIASISPSQGIGYVTGGGTSIMWNGYLGGICNNPVVTLFIAQAVSPVPGDIDGNGLVNGADLGLLLSSWGPCGACPADLDGDGVVGGVDLGTLLGAWTS